MTEDVERITETTSRLGGTIQKTTETNSSKDRTEYHREVAERVIWFVAGIILVLLGLRFILALLGANTINSFANFIYSTSHPFIYPFFSLFNGNKYTYGVAHFEGYTLLAMVVYAIVAWGITTLVTINRD